jgi:tol-pal system protein YbgF
MTCMTLRPALLPVIALTIVSSMRIAAAQESDHSGFLDNLFGGSDRFSQQPQQGQPERGTQGEPSELAVRLDRLEAQVRQLTGTIEQLQYRNQQLETALQQMRGGPPREAQPRPGSYQVPAQPRPGAYEAPAQPPATAGRHGDAFDPSEHPNAPGAPHALGTRSSLPPSQPPVASMEAPAGAEAPPNGTPLDLSTLAGAAANDPTLRPGAAPPAQNAPPRGPSPSSRQVATLPPSDSPRDNFDLAYGYFEHRDYPLAEQGFRGFLQRFPNDRLTPDAEYWLGESLFQRQQFRDAAEAFLTVSTKYETTAKAPEALLRLGQSLAALGEKEAACASLGEVLRKYPRASVAVKQGVDREQKRARC